MFLIPLYPFISYNFKASYNLADAQLGILIAIFAPLWHIWVFKTMKRMSSAEYVNRVEWHEGDLNSHSFSKLLIFHFNVYIQNINMYYNRRIFE